MRQYDLAQLTNDSLNKSNVPYQTMRNNPSPDPAQCGKPMALGTPFFYYTFVLFETRNICINRASYTVNENNEIFVCIYMSSSFTTTTTILLCPYNRTLSNIAFTIFPPVKLLMHNTIFCIQNHYTAINVTSLPTIRRISMYVDALNK